MELYIIRHGIAVNREDPAVKSDEERWLTDKGRERMQPVAAGFTRLVPDLDVILSSPLRRARETAEIVAQAYDRRIEIQEVGDLKPGFDPKTLLRLLQDLPKRSQVALVGHEPDLSELAAALLSGSIEMDIIMKKGGICGISFDGKPGFGAGSLQFLLPPKVFRLQAAE
jgi:phosphohistidine phosphatase